MQAIADQNFGMFCKTYITVSAGRNLINIVKNTEKVMFSQPYHSWVAGVLNSEGPEEKLISSPVKYRNEFA